MRSTVLLILAFLVVGASAGLLVPRLDDLFRRPPPSELPRPLMNRSYDIGSTNVGEGSSGGSSFHSQGGKLATPPGKRSTQTRGPGAD
jgi:hypothetical protein